MGIPLRVICCFSLAAFNFYSFYLVFVRLINTHLRVFHLRFTVFGTLGFLDLGGCFLPHFRDVFNYYLLKYFLMPFLFVSFLWDTYDSNVGAFNVVPEVSEFVLICFYSFLLSASFISTILSSASLILSYLSVILSLVPSKMLLHCSLLIDSFLFLLVLC